MSDKWAELTREWELKNHLFEEFVVWRKWKKGKKISPLYAIFLAKVSSFVARLYRNAYGYENLTCWLYIKMAGDLMKPVSLKDYRKVLKLLRPFPFKLLKAGTTYSIAPATLSFKKAKEILDYLLSPERAIDMHPFRSIENA